MQAIIVSVLVLLVASVAGLAYVIWTQQRRLALQELRLRALKLKAAHSAPAELLARVDDLAVAVDDAEQKRRTFEARIWGKIGAEQQRALALTTEESQTVTPAANGASNRDALRSQYLPKPKGFVR